MPRLKPSLRQTDRSPKKAGALTAPSGRVKQSRRGRLDPAVVGQRSCPATPDCHAIAGARGKHAGGVAGRRVPHADLDSVHSHRSLGVIS